MPENSDVIYLSDWINDSEEGKFFTYNYFRTLSDKVYGTFIRDESLLDVVKSNISIKSHLAGDLANEYLIDDNDYLQRLSHELSYHISNIKKQVIDSEKYSSLMLEKVWVNYMRPADFNPHHSHSGTLSFVYYIDVPEKIRQEHTQSENNSKNRGLISFYAGKTNDTMAFNPKRGDLLIFESDHCHGVYPFYSDNTRITVAGNLSLQ